MHFYRWETEKRYYEALALQDLWGQWVVIQRWGGKHNRRGSMRSIPVAYDELDTFIAQIDRVRRKHGYFKHSYREASTLK